MPEAARNMGEVRIEAAEFWRKIRGYKKLFTRREWIVLERRYLFDETLREIAPRIKRSVSRVAQIELCVLRKLRRYLPPPRPSRRFEWTKPVSDAERPFLEVLCEANFYKPYQSCSRAQQLQMLTFARTDYWVQQAIRRGDPTPQENFEPLRPIRPYSVHPHEQGRRLTP